MQNQPTHHTNTLKYIAIAIAALAGVVLAGFATITILRSILPVATHNATSPPSGKALSAAEVIKAYEAPNAVDALSHYNHQIGSTDEGSVSYRQASQPYAIIDATKDSALFSAKDTKQASDTAAIQKQTASFMDAEGLAKGSTPPQNLRSGLVYTTYENTQTVCQLIDAEATPQFPSYHTLSCIAKTDINKEYSAIQKLLAISGQKTDVSGAQTIRRATDSKDNKSYAILDVTNSGNKSTRFLYAAVDNKWEYLGDLNAGDKQYAGTKYTITPQIQKAISDPKYGNFLTSAIH